MEYPIIPIQSEGEYHDSVEMHCDGTLNKAKANFEILKIRLQSVNEWHTYSEKIKSKFEMLDSSILECSKELKIGNFMKFEKVL